MADSTTVAGVSGTAPTSSYQPAITFTGLGSGLDSASIIEKLVEAESGQVRRLESWKAEWTAKIEALETMGTKLADLKTAAQGMEALSQFQAKTAAVSAAGVLGAAATGEAASGTRQVLVNQLAQSEVEVHAGVGASTTVINSSGAARVFAFSYAGGVAVSITVPDGATLAYLAAAINANGANPGVSAMVLDMGPAYTTDRYRLMLQGQDTGLANTITVDDALTTLDGAGGTVNFEGGNFTQSQAAQNAQLRLDGYPPGSWLERTGNLVADVIPGVTLTLLSTSATQVEVTVQDDTATMQEKVEDLVQKFNDLVAYIREQTAYDFDNKEAGILLGNYAVQIVKSSLNAIASGNAPGFKDGSDSCLNLAQLGITTDVDETSATFEQLLIDEAALAGVLSTDPEGVAKLMAAYFQGVSDDSSGNIEFYSSIPGITQPGTYEVSATVAGGVLTGGTINGHAATVSGDTLTGMSGYPEYGLAVRVNLADGTHTGTVRLKLGVAGQLSEKLDELSSASSGPVNILIDNYHDIVDNIDEKIEFEQRRLEGVRQRLIERFSRLETVLAQLNDQSNYLTSQIQKLGISSRQS